MASGAADQQAGQLLQAALQHQQAGRWQQAEALYKQVLRNSPDNPDALCLLGMLTHQAGNSEVAAEIINRAILINPNNPATHNILGSIYNTLKKPGDAVRCYQKALALKPDDADVHYNMGNAFSDQGKTEEAIACYKKAVALRPNYVYAHYSMGDALKQQGKLDEAGVCYRKALALKPDYAEAHNNLGAALEIQGKQDEAITCYQKAIELKPDYVKAHCNLGFALLCLEQYDSAEQHFEAAFRASPDCPEAHVGAAMLHHKKYKQLPEAEKAARKAIALGHDKPDVHTLLGTIYTEMGKPEQANESYAKALKLDADDFGALLARGDLYMETGDFRQAEECFSRIVSNGTPLQKLSARCHLAQVKKVRAGDENMAALLAAAEGMKSLPPSMAIDLHFALGKGYDDTGDYAKAMEYFKQGGALRRKKGEYDPDANDRKLDRLIEIFNPSSIERLRGGGDPSRLPIFVLGMPRSGTTLTEQIIASHPDVYGAGELVDLTMIAARPTDADAFFPDNLKALTPQLLVAWGADYIGGLKKIAPDASRITDKMPGNHLVIGLIHLMLPNAKIIHVNRSPVDTCLSCFTKLFNYGHEYSYDLHELGRYYAGYARLMQHWRDVLPEGAFLDVQYEELVADTETQSRRLINYCGLEWNEACLNFHEAKRSVRTASMTQVRQPIYKSSVERWRNYEGSIGSLLEALEGLI